MEKYIPLIVANWKMHPPPGGFDAKDSPYRPRKDADVIVLPTFLDLARCIEAGLTVGAQCGHPEKDGAHTGDVSMAMLADLGCNYVLCGHSERRTDRGETDDFVARQVLAALEAGLVPIVCIGETAQERAAGKAKEVVQRQLETVLHQLPFNESSEAAGLVGPAAGGLHKGKREFAREKPLGCSFALAYEPVWAISRGDPTKPAMTSEDAQQMHAFIRSKLETGNWKLETLSLLYGGSVKPENASALIAKPDIDGFLVGGASLDPSAFRAIVASCTS